MPHLDKRARLRISGYLLLAITLRSFVAAGWMLQVPASSGLSAPILSICPMQTQGIDDWLSSANTIHAHHGSGHSDGGGDASVTTSDPSCSVWASTALTIIAGTQSVFTIPRIAPPVILNESFDLDRPLGGSRKTRAPPELS